MITTTVVKLLAKRVLYRTPAQVRRKMGSGGVSPETPTTHWSPVNRLPMEVFESIISYLIYDTQSPRMHLDLLHLVHRRCSSSLSHPYH